MKRICVYILLLVPVMLMACGSSVYKDGKQVCERLINLPGIDTLEVENMLNQVDSLITPEILGRDFGITLVKNIESDSVINRKELNRRITLFRRIYADREGERDCKRFSIGLQSVINAMPVERQMKIYSKISTPAQMGTAFRIDRYRVKEDSVAINKRIEVLRHIYNNEEMMQFMECYNR